MRKEYELQLYYKQGDDLNACLNEAKTAQGAFSLFSDQIKSSLEIVDRLLSAMRSMGIDDQDISVMAGTNTICLESFTEKGATFLEKMEKEGVLHGYETEEDDWYQDWDDGAWSDDSEEEIETEEEEHN